MIIRCLYVNYSLSAFQFILVRPSRICSSFVPAVVMFTFIYGDLKSPPKSLVWWSDPAEPSRRFFAMSHHAPLLHLPVEDTFCCWGGTAPLHAPSHWGASLGPLPLTFAVPQESRQVIPMFTPSVLEVGIASLHVPFYTGGSEGVLLLMSTQTYLDHSRTNPHTKY